MIRLHLLGAVRLETEAGATRRSALSQPRRTALLAWLALRARRGPERRDTLLGVFWPESDANHARGALRNALHYLRNALGPDVLLSHGSEEVQLDLEVVWCDAVEFERLCDGGEYAAALRLYTGDLLEGFFVSEAPAFEQWLEVERTRLRQRAAEAARKLADTAEAEGELQLAALRLRHLLELVPTDEAAARHLMRLLSASDDRGGALRVVAMLQSRLEEYGLEPADETLELADRIRRGAAVEVAPAWTLPRTTAAAPRASANLATVAPADTPAVPDPTAGPAAADRALPPADRASARRSHARLWVITPVALAASVALVALVLTVLARSQVGAVPSRDVVAVLPFEYRGSADHAYLAEGMADLLAANLHGAGDLQAVDPRALLPGLQTLAQPIPLATAERAAAGHGAALFVLGSITEAAGQLRIAAALHEAGPRGGGGRRRTEIIVEGRADDILSLVDRVTFGLLQRAGTSAVTQAALRTTRSVEALKSYLSGEAALRRADIHGAVEHFRRATQLDSTFALAHYRLSSAAYRWGIARVPAPAAEAALRHAGRLVREDSLLVAAWYHHVKGSVERAHAYYQEALHLRGSHVEAAFQLGELRFHWGAAIGVPAAAAREPFSRVLAAEPHNVEAALHLARLAAREERLGALDSLVALMHRADPDGRWRLEMAVLRAFLLGDRAAQDRAIAADGGQDWLLEAAAAHTARFADVERVLRERLAIERDPGGSARVHLFLAHVRLGRGRFRDAAGGMASASLPEARRLEYRAMMATLPFLPLRRDELLAIRAELTAHPDMRVRDDGGPLASRAIEYPHVLWPGLFRPRRLYLLGALHVQLGDHAAAVAVADSLAAEVAIDLFAPGYERLTRARMAAERGDWAAVLHTLGPPQPPPLRTFEDFVDHGRPYERWLRAEALRESGRAAEALRWYGTFPDPIGRDLAFVAPSHLRRAEIFDAAGDRDQAAFHYRRFIQLWTDADPDLQPQVEAARARLRALSAR